MTGGAGKINKINGWFLPIQMTPIPPPMSIPTKKKQKTTKRMINRAFCLNIDSVESIHSYNRVPIFLINIFTSFSSTTEKGRGHTNASPPHSFCQPPVAASTITPSVLPPIIVTGFQLMARKYAAQSVPLSSSKRQKAVSA